MPFVASVTIWKVLPAPSAPSSGSLPVSVGACTWFVPPGLLCGAAVLSALSGNCSMPKFWPATLLVTTATVSLLSAVASGVPFEFSPVVTQFAGSWTSGAGCPTVPGFFVICSV